MPYKIDGTLENRIITYKNPFPFNSSLPFYCEQDILGFYDIDYDIISEETLTNYCEQDILGFYDIDYDIIPEETLTNYCEFAVEQEIDIYEIDPPSFLSDSATTALWLDADDSSTITLVSGAVSQWNDKSGNTRHASQGTAGNRPTISVVNSLNRVSFNGSSSFLSCGDTLDLLTGEWLFLLVGQKSGSNQSFFAKSVAAGSPNRYSLLDDATNLVSLFASPTNTVHNTTTFTNSLTTTNLFGVSYSFANKENKLWLNGVNERTISTSTWTSSMNSTYRFLMGAYNNSNDTGQLLYLNGNIAEFIVLNTLSQANRELVEGYLAWKWGLVANLPSGHPYKNDYPDKTLIGTETISIYDFAQAP